VLSPPTVSPPAVSPHTLVRDVAEVGLIRIVGALAVILPSVALVQVLANTRDYRQPAVAVAAWLAVLGAAAWLVPRLRRGGLSAGETAAAIAIEVVAVAVIGMARRAGANPGNVDLVILGTIWLLVLVVISRPALVWIPGALIVFATQGVLLIGAWGLNPLSLSEFEAAGFILAAVLIPFAVVQPAVAVHASIAARRAALASRSAAESAAAAAIAQERRSRLAVLEKEALPLLRGIADGTLDATADDVRERCARHAAVLRHSLTGRAPAAGGLMAGLEPTLRAARERGLLVTVQVVGDPGTARPPVADAVRDAVDAVISALAPQQVTLTVLASGDDVELYLIFGGPTRSLPDLARFARGLPAAANWRATVIAEETGGGSLEISWRKDGAA
jgi:hypothetical protein